MSDRTREINSTQDNTRAISLYLDDNDLDTIANQLTNPIDYLSKLCSYSQDDRNQKDIPIYMLKGGV